MSALSDIELLVPSVGGLLDSVDERHSAIIEALQTEASSGLVNGLRVARLQRTIVAIGIFSLFEALLQHEMGWERPFARLKECLKANAKDTLAARFEDYILAINVLKHGAGPSHEKLKTRADKLDFGVKQGREEFFFEGDVGEGQPLIDVDSLFVQRCAELVDSCLEAIRVAPEDTL